MRVIFAAIAAWIIPLAHAASDAPKNSGSSRPDASAPMAATITEDGVGPIRVGRPFVDAFRDRKLLQASYVTRFYADYQPLEGFAFASPPVTVYVHGAFYNWGKTNPSGDTPRLRDRLRAQTIDLVMTGQLPITMIGIESTQLATARGVAVGSSVADAMLRYPKLSIQGIPALWEEPTYVATEGRLAFFFSTTNGRSSATNSRVLRIVIYDRDPWQGNP